MAEITRACGYVDAASFTRLFRARLGLTPREYRRGRREVPETTRPRAYLKEDFDDAARWSAVEGEWRLSGGVFEGVHRTGFRQRLDRELPEGFLLDLDVRIEALAGRDRPQAILSLIREAAPMLEIVLIPRPGPCRIDREGRVSDYASGGIKAGSWHHVIARIESQAVAVRIDGKALFRHSMSFPLSGVSLHRLALGGYGSRAFFRHLRIYAAPGPTRETPEEEGDARFLSADMPGAIDRYVVQASDPALRPRLAWKIAACWRDRGLPAREHAWLRASTAGASHAPWTTLSRLALAGLSGRLEAEARPALDRSAERRTTVLEVHSRMMTAHDTGDAVEAHRLAALLREKRQPKMLEGELHSSLIDSLIELGRFAEAERTAGEVAREHPAGDWTRTGLLRLAAFAAFLAGKKGEAVRLTEQAETEAADETGRWAALSTRALILRGLGRTTDSEALFDRVAENTGWTQGREHALFHLGLSLAARGELARARGHIERMREVPSVYAVCGRVYLAVIENDFVSSCDRLREGLSLPASDPAWPRSARLFLALLSLASEREEAASEIFSELTRPRRTREADVACFHLGRADRVAMEKALGRFPFAGGPINRPVFLLLEGMLAEREGDTEQASRCFRAAAAVDPTRPWAAVLAERRVNKGDRPQS